MKFRLFFLYITAAICLGALGCTPCDRQQGQLESKTTHSGTAPPAPLKVLVVVHSYTGKTALVAEQIATAFSADLVALNIAPPPGSWGAPRDAAAFIAPQRGLRDADPTAYDLVFLGSPIWDQGPTQPLFDFIEKHSWRGVRVVEFHTFFSSYDTDRIDALSAAIGRKGGEVIDVFAIRSPVLATPQAYSLAAQSIIHPRMERWLERIGLNPADSEAESKTRSLPLPHQAEQRFIPAGNAWLGCVDPQQCYAGTPPARLAHIEQFWIDRAEVTGRQYERCVKQGACTPPDPIPPCDAMTKNVEWPIACVSFQQAEDYCRWVGMELPRESQWVRAARGARRIAYPWGDELGASGQHVYYSEDKSVYNIPADRASGMNIDSFIHRPCSDDKGLSPFGVCDMAGNVSEFVHADSGQYGLTEQMQVLSAGALIKGGSGFDFDPRSFEISSQGQSFDMGIYFAGFRCVSRE